MKCDNCSCTESYIKDYKHDFNIRGKEISFISKRRFCKNCNNFVYDKELDNEASEKAIEIYNDKYGIPKEKIKILRNKNNLSQEQFSKIIGCAKKTLISYEKGTALPNDNYVILINSIEKEPDIIELLLDSNKDKYSESEYKKIKNKILKFIENNSISLQKEEDIFKPSEYNGYTKLDFNKVINTILYFAEEGILKTKLMKEMFYADFINYKHTGKSITGLKYAKINYGPVPDEKDKIISECISNKYIEEEIEYKNDYEYHKIISLKKFDSKLFDSKEVEVLKRVKEYFKKFNSKDITEFSHEEKAFTETKFAKNISYDYAFDINRID